MKFLYMLLNPVNLYWRIVLKYVKRKLRHCGENFNIGHNFIIHGAENISIGNDVNCEHNVYFFTYSDYNNKSTDFSPNLEINNNVKISYGTFISCLNNVVIGEGTLIGANSYISDNFHGKNIMSEVNTPPAMRDLYSKGPVKIGKNVWLGRNVCVMPNVTIGDYAVVGANAVVTHDLPPYSISAGCPAKVIKMINE